MVRKSGWFRSSTSQGFCLPESQGGQKRPALPSSHLLQFARDQRKPWRWTCFVNYEAPALGKIPRGQGILSREGCKFQFGLQEEKHWGGFSWPPHPAPYTVAARLGTRAALSTPRTGNGRHRCFSMFPACPSQAWVLPNLITSVLERKMPSSRRAACCFTAE